MKKNLVISVSDGYNYYTLAPFIESLARVGYQGHTCVFMGPMTKPDAVRQLRKAGVEVLRYTNVFPFVAAPHPENFPALPHPIHIWNARHFLYYDYLLKHEGEFENILLTDIRDVIFQRDPFDFSLGTALNVAMEDRATLLASTPSNREWIERGYGAAMLAEVGHFPVSCAGTILGRASVIQVYLRNLLTEVGQLKDALNCADQAAHNVMLHQDRLGPVRRHYNEDGPILTVGTLEQNSRFSFDEEGYVLNQAGKRPHIVHQYDRHPQLAARMERVAYGSSLRKPYLELRYLMPLRRGYQQLLKLLGK